MLVDYETYRQSGTAARVAASSGEGERDTSEKRWNLRDTARMLEAPSGSNWRRTIHMRPRGPEKTWGNVSRRKRERKKK